VLVTQRLTRVLGELDYHFVRVYLQRSNGEGVRNRASSGRRKSTTQGPYVSTTTWRTLAIRKNR
jgi:hypothetical protein